MATTRRYEATRFGGLDALGARRLELFAIGLVTCGVGLLYWRVNAAALNTPGYLDPWIYDALFQNFGYLYHAFYSAYYTSRLPWIIPGEAAHAVLPTVAAFFLLHITFILAAGAAVYALLRRFFGTAIAVVGYSALLLNVIFYNAHSDDYPDGPQITYLLLTISTALLATRSSRPIPLMFASGFFASAAIGTNLFAAFFVATASLAYLAAISPRPQFVRQFIRDAVAFVCGTMTLLVSVGAYARAHGGEFLFFMPSVRSAQVLSTKNWRISGYQWMLGEPRLLAPAFIVVIGIIALWPSLHDWKRDQAVRVAVGLTASLGMSTAVLSVWEFRYHGIAVFDIPYYFSVFIPLLVLTAASVAGVVIDRSSLDPTGRRLLAIAAVVASALPVWVIYGPPVTGIIGRTGFFVSVALMAVAGVLAVLFGFGPRRTRSVTAIALVASVFLSLNFSAAASRTSERFHASATGSRSYAGRLAAMHMTDQLIVFMRRHGLQPTGPLATPANFWFNATSDPAINSIQSAYLYGWTAAGFDLPRIDAAMKRILAARRPPVMVLLCRAHCGAGVASLQRSGYKPSLRASGELASGAERLWVRAYTLADFAADSPEKRFYLGGASPLTRPAGSIVERWRFRTPPAGWSGAALDSLSVHGTATTSTRKWNYEMVSPAMTLPAGFYRVLLDGRVLRGGMDIGVLNLGKNVWVSQRFYWHGQKFAAGLWMVTPFRLDGVTRVEVVLSNWVPVDAASRWRLHELRLVRVS